MKKDIWITLLLAIALVIGVSLLNFRNSKKEDDYFFVDTPIDLYTPLTSSVKGFPFVIKCNNNQVITVFISSGKLQNEEGILSDNKVTCGTTIYWNEEGTEEQVEITFQSNNQQLKTEKFILLQNEKKEYLLKN